MIARLRPAQRRRIVSLALAALLCAALSGCAALPWAAARPRGERLLKSPGCHCRVTYPAAWFASAANGDSSEPALGLHSYDESSADHAPIPARYADIGIDWQDDPMGQLYLATTTSHISPLAAQHLTVSGWPATAYAQWTAPPAQGGIYQQHIYLFVPWYQRDYDISFSAANPPGNDITGLRNIFMQVVHSLVIVPPTAAL